MATCIQTKELPNGLRVIFEPNASPVLHCGYVVCAGTRNEAADDSGMAHFIEHMTFKGTERRRACHISNGLERVGGELNAYTTKQLTTYYATVLKEDFARAADLLTDIVFHSTFPQAEINKEVEVICDEIDSYRDSPAELIFDEFEQMLYKGQSLGRDILGAPERLRAYRTADALRFADRHYVPARAVFYVYGDIPFRRVVDVLERQFDKYPLSAQKQKSNLFTEGNAPVPTFSAPERRAVGKDTHQVHVLIGGPALGGRDPRRHALALLNNMLGGPCMNSRLCASLRERRGLVYSVDSYLNLFPDTGYWNAYFGCNPGDEERCLRLVQRELRRFIEEKVSPATLRAAQKQFIGQVLIGGGNAESHAGALGKTFALYGTHYDADAVCRAITDVTADDLQRIAAEVYAPERLTTLLYT